MVTPASFSLSKLPEVCLFLWAVLGLCCNAWASLAAACVGSLVVVCGLSSWQCMGSKIPDQGLGAQSLIHWTIREGPGTLFQPDFTWVTIWGRGSGRRNLVGVP